MNEMLVKMLFSLLVCLMLSVSVSAAVVDEALIYASFDGTWANHGTAGTGEVAQVWTGGDGSTPVFSSGLKGSAMDLTSATTVDSGSISWHSASDTAISLQGLMSYTVTLWINAAGQTAPFGTSGAVVWDRESDRMQNFMTNTGTPRIRVNGSWAAIPSDVDVIPPADGWYFLAVTYDATVSAGEQVSRIYVSNPSPGQSYSDALKEVTLHPSYDGTVNKGPMDFSARRFIIGNRAIPTSASVKYGSDIMIDEFRIFGAAFGSADESAGALTSGQIAEVMNLSLPHTYCSVYFPSDLDNDCYVTLNDMAVFVAQWLECTDVDNPICN